MKLPVSSAQQRVVMAMFVNNLPCPLTTRRAPGIDSTGLMTLPEIVLPRCSEQSMRARLRIDFDLRQYEQRFG